MKDLAPWGPWLGALATFFAVLVALRLHTKFFPPKLKLSLRSEDGEVTDVILETTDADGTVTSRRKERARYYHVKLTNERPWFVATEADVMLVSVAAPDAAGAYIETWSGQLPIVATHYGVHPTRTLGASPQYFDLCSVVREKWVQLHPRIVPNNFPHRHRVGEMSKLRITLQAVSLESLSERFTFDIAWNGTWVDDTIAMRQHMVVRQLPLQGEI